MNERGKAQAQTLIAAVSGGVDSVVMLHRLVKDGQKPIVGHFDHGMRDDSAADVRFVEGLARQYDLVFESGEGRLGANAGEDRARTARHLFLQSISRKYGDSKIATAHHHDDVVETAVINILRGTGRRGMSSLKDTDIYSRPLINWTRHKIYDYAAQNHLEWVEDPTNLSDKYLRNRIRHRLIPLLRQKEVLDQFEELVDWFYASNAMIDKLVEQILVAKTETTRDHIALEIDALSDQAMANEILVTLLKRLGAEIDQTEISRLVDFAKVAREGAVFNQFPPVHITKQSKWLLFESQTASLER